jgi:hypothetical protein
MRLEGQRLGKFSYRTRRAMEMVCAIPCIVLGLNLLFSWKLFGEHGGAVFALSVAFLFLVMRFLGPGPDEARSRKVRGEPPLGG